MVINTFLILLFIFSLICVNIGAFFLGDMPGLGISGGLTGVCLTIILDKYL